MYSGITNNNPEHHLH